MSETALSWSDFVERDAPDDEIVKALAAIGSGAMYIVVLRAFHGDQKRAARALRNLEKSGAIVHGNDGWIARAPTRAHASVVSEVGPDVPRQTGQGGPALDQ